jgi:hypothetical protein
MLQIQHVSRALVPLIANGEVPNTIIAVIGEIVSIDASFSDQPLRGTHEQLSERLEAYDKILQRAIFATEEFSKNYDSAALREAMLEIKERLVALG